VITGANAGLGYETALNLASRGASVIMVCRSAEKGAQARKAIIASTGNQEVHVWQVDLASQQQIRDLGARMQSHNHAIDVLINNAGLVRSQFAARVGAHRGAHR